MHKFSAIFLVTLMTLNLASALKLHSIDSFLLPSNSINAQLTQLLIQVQQTDSPRTIKTFLKQIQDMMVKLQDEQKKHQEISDKMMAQCTEEDKFRAKEVTDATDALNRANEAKSKCDASLQSSNKDLPDLKNALTTYETQLQAAVDQRAAENKSYKQRKADFEEAIAFLKDFITYVNDKLKGSLKAFSFVERSEQLLRHATKLGLLGEAVPVLVAIAQSEIPAANNYSYTPNEDAGTKLKDTLNDLLNRLNNDWKSNESNEQAALKAFTELKTKLDAAIATLKTNIQRTEEQITKMTKCVADESVVVNKASAKLERNTTLKNSASKMCSQFALEFIDATKNRTEEIQTVREILAIIEKRFGKIPEDLKLYLESVENGWKQYQNSTEFKKYVEYQQQHSADNDNGRSLATTNSNKAF